MNINFLPLTLALGMVADAQTPFACNRLALTPETRARHFNELGPALRQLTKSVRELPDGYEFQFVSSAATFHLLTEWVAGEYLCCPFFDIDVLVSREGGPLRLRLTGRDGVKQFIQADFSRWFPA